MAIGWLTALKVIPWGDVIEAAPRIANGARKFFARTQRGEAPAPPDGVAPQATTDDDALVRAQRRIGQLEASLAELDGQQQASAELIKSLAEQNAKVVQALEILRVRVRLLLVACAALAVLLVALAGWMAR